MFQLIGKLLASGVPRENILYLNFFDDRLHHLRPAAAPKFPNRIGPPPCGTKSLPALMPAAHELIGQRAT